MQDGFPFFAQVGPLLAHSLLSVNWKKKKQNQTEPTWQTALREGVPCSGREGVLLRASCPRARDVTGWVGHVLEVRSPLLLSQAPVCISNLYVGPWELRPGFWKNLTLQLKGAAVHGATGSIFLSLWEWPSTCRAKLRCLWESLSPVYRLRLLMYVRGANTCWFCRLIDWRDSARASNQPAIPTFSAWSSYELSRRSSLWAVSDGRGRQAILLGEMMPLRWFSLIWASAKQGRKHLESVPFLSEWEVWEPGKPWPLNQSPRPNTIWWLLLCPQCPLEPWSHKSIEGGRSLPWRGLGASSSCSLQASVIAGSKCYPLGPQGLKAQPPASLAAEPLESWWGQGLVARSLQRNQVINI